MPVRDISLSLSYFTSMRLERKGIMPFILLYSINHLHGPVDNGLELGRISWFYVSNSWFTYSCLIKFERKRLMTRLSRFDLKERKIIGTNIYTIKSFRSCHGCFVYASCLFQNVNNLERSEDRRVFTTSLKLYFHFPTTYNITNKFNMQKYVRKYSTDHANNHSTVM